jgi:hypothetical protein
MKILQHRELGIEREGLRHVTDAAPDIHIVRIDLVPEQPGRAFTGRQQSGQHLHGRGLAAAVRAEKAEDFAPLDAKADVVDSGETVESHRQMRGFDRDVAIQVCGPRRNRHLRVAAAFLFRE